MTEDKYLVPDKGEKFINNSRGIPLIDREISWLCFNNRVISLSDREGISPSRFHFLIIAESNLDEFISVRFPDIVKACEPENKTLKAYYDMILKEIKIQKAIIESKLSKIFTKYTNVHNSLNAEVGNIIFNKKIKAVLDPVLVGPNKDIPKFKSDELNLFVKLMDSSQKKVYCFIQIPSKLDRLYKIESSEEKITVPIERIISNNITEVFSDLYTIEGCILFKVIKRCNDIIDGNNDTPIVDKVNKIITNREDNRIIWIDYTSMIGTSEELVDKMILKLRKLLKVQKECVMFYQDSISINSEYARKLARIKEDKSDPQPINELIDEDSIMDYLDDNCDLIVHHPYQSFKVVINYLKEAANDPKVISIRQTLYRVSSIKSPIVKHLCDAARNGKHVHVMLELFARFDEKQNIKLINHFKEAGCNVSYSLESVKTHCKLCVVTKKEKSKLINYAHIGTGNYNEKTSKIYTDISYFTKDEATCNSLIDIFGITTGFLRTSELPNLCYSPSTMLPNLLNILSSLEQWLSLGENHYASINIKVNSLSNYEIIKAIYELAENYRCRFTVHLICRGICSMVSRWENIQIKSIVGKYLEHSRIIIAHTFVKTENSLLSNSKYTTLIGSSDLLDRNLFKRIEILVEVKTESSQQKVRNIFDTLWKDTDNSWYMDSSGKYTMNNTKEYHYNAHEALQES